MFFNFLSTVSTGLQAHTVARWVISWIFYFINVIIHVSGTPLLVHDCFLIFLIPYTVSRTPWTGKLAYCKALAYTQDNTNRINVHKRSCLNGIRTHDHSIQAGRDNSSLRLQGYNDQQVYFIMTVHQSVVVIGCQQWHSMNPVFVSAVDA
jgi:hypothetical protein